MIKLSPALIAFMALLPIAAADAAPDRAVAAPSLSTSLTPQQRGEAIGQFVRKWGPYVENTYGIDVGTWSRRLVRDFVSADPVNLQRALARTTLEGAMAELSGTGLRLSDEQVISKLAKATISGFQQAPTLSAVTASTTTDLVFTPITPCRIVDTRLAGGAIGAGQNRGFPAWGQPSYAPWGGAANDCGMASDHPSAIMLNVTAVRPTVAGYATVYAGDLASPPFAASVNYDVNAIENGIVVTKIAPVFPDYKIYSFAQSDYVVDIIGFFAAPHATALDCTDVASATINIAAGARAFGTTPACAVGYTPVFGGIAATGASDNQTLNALDTDATSFFYSMTNTSGGTKSYVAHTRCCRVPGR